MDEKPDNRDALDVTASDKAGLAPAGAEKVAQKQVNAFLIDEPATEPGVAAAAAPAKDSAPAATPAPAKDTAAAATPAPAAEDTAAEATPRPPPPSVAQGGTPVPGSAMSAEQLEYLTTDIVAALKTVYDPEIPTDIYELGLIYKIDVGDDRDITIDMTLTAPGCPVAGEMPIWVENAVSGVPGVGDVFVNLTFDPPWEMSMMSEEARVALNMF